MTLVLLAIAVCSGLNRARGAEEDWMPPWLPGRALLYTTAGYGLVALLATFDLVTAGLWAATVFVWAVGPWGHLIGLGRWAPQDRPPHRLEALLLRAARGNVHGALFLRMLFALPGFIALAWWHDAAWLIGLAPIFAATAVGVYERAWSELPDNPIWAAELIVGALLGALILTVGGAS